MLKVIFEGDDQTNAQFIRSCVKSLGQEIPGNWTDEQVIQFFNTLSQDAPRLYADMEKAEMKYDAEVAGD